MQTHPWRLLDAHTGELVKEVFAEEPLSDIYVDDLDFEVEEAPPSQATDFRGFDGIGGETADYGAAKVLPSSQRLVSPKHNQHVTITSNTAERKRF
jgi:hypothetical protein